MYLHTHLHTYTNVNSNYFESFYHLKQGKNFANNILEANVFLIKYIVQILLEKVCDEVKISWEAVKYGTSIYPWFQKSANKEFTPKDLLKRLCRTWSSSGIVEQTQTNSLTNSSSGII